MYYQDAWRTARAANRPLANRLGFQYAQLSGAYALLQVVVSMSTAAAYQGSLVTLLHANDPAAGVVPLEFVLPPVLTGIISCLIGGILSLIISYYVARNTAQTTRDAGLGQRAGVIASAMGSVAWLGFSIIGALLSGTDGFIYTVDGFSNVATVTQMLSAVFIVAVRALVIGAFTLLPAYLVATMGAGVGKSRP